MQVKIKNINPNEATALKAFYAVGQTIRQKGIQEIDWNDDHGLDQIIDDSEIAVKLFIGENMAGSGRIAAIKYPDQNEGIIGWYECENSTELSNALFEAAIEFLKLNEATKIIGPINGSTWNNYRFNKTAEKPLLPGDPYQPLYYIELWAKFGFKEYATYQSDIAPNDLFEPMTMEEGQELANQFNLTVDFYPPQPSEEFLDKMYDFYHACFESNPLFKSIEREAYRKLSGKFAQILNAKHSLLVCDRENNPVAVTLSYEDIYHSYYEAGKIKDPDHSINRLFIKTIATRPEYQGKQIGTLMINLVHNLANVSGYEKIYHLLMYQNNLSATKGKEKFVTEKTREYAIYYLDL